MSIYFQSAETTLDFKTVKYLDNMCRALKIKGYSKYRKDDKVRFIIETLKERKSEYGFEERYPDTQIKIVNLDPVLFTKNYDIKKIAHEGYGDWKSEYKKLCLGITEYLDKEKYCEVWGVGTLGYFKKLNEIVYIKTEERKKAEELRKLKAKEDKIKHQLEEERRNKRYDLYDRVFKAVSPYLFNKFTFVIFIIYVIMNFINSFHPTTSKKTYYKPTKAISVPYKHYKKHKIVSRLPDKPGYISVGGYYKDDGTYVAPHYRSVYSKGDPRRVKYETMPKKTENFKINIREEEDDNEKDEDINNNIVFNDVNGMQLDTRKNL